MTTKPSTLFFIPYVEKIQSPFSIVSFTLYLLLIAFPFNGIAQNNKCDTVKNEIKAFAKRHIDNSALMQTNMVIDVVDARGCFSKQEIALIYENEYGRLRKEKVKKEEEDFWQKLNPNIGWIIAIISILILAFRSFLQKRCEQLFDWFSLQIHKNLAGNRMFNRFAIKKYKHALTDKYSKIKIPFRQSRPLEMKEVYIPLKALNSNQTSEIDVLGAITEHKKAMIVGPPGSGKSMLCKNIMFNFGSGNLSSKYIPILIELHRLNNDQATIRNVLEDELKRNSFPKPERFIDYNLKQGNLLLLFDGFDEVSSSERKRVAQLLNDFIDEFDCPNFIITCRTAVYRNEFDKIVNKHLELSEFNNHQIRQFLQAWETDIPQDKSIEQLMTILQDSPQIMSLAKNPLMLTIIAYLYADTVHVLPRSRGEFYSKATDILLDQWHEERNAFKAASKSLILQQLALSNQDEEKSKTGDRKVINTTKVIAEIKQMLPRLDLPADDTSKILNEIVERSGLLLVVDGGEYYQFAHLTMQEFFAAKQLRDNEQGLLERFKADQDSWREPVKLWCGLSNDATEFIKSIFKIDKIVAFECITEARSVDPATADCIIEHFTQNITSQEYESDRVYKAFGLVASDISNRGTQFFNFLEKQLQHPEDPPKTSFIIKCLAYTFLPKAATVLAGYYVDYGYYVHEKDLFEALLKMGDIALPALQKIINSGNLKAIDCLAQIQTPEAALTLLSFIWEDEEKAIIASLYLAQLISQPLIEDALRKQQLGILEKKSPYYDWVWKPFKDSVNTSLHYIAGRIVFLIQSNKTVALNHYKNITMDIRIAVPLAILNPEVDFSLLSNRTREVLSINKDEYNTARTFLKNQDNNVPKFKKLVQVILGDLANVNYRNLVFVYVISVLPLDLSFNLIRSLYQRRPTIVDWTNIFKPTKYKFLTSFEFISLFIITTLMAILAFSIKEINLNMYSPSSFTKTTALTLSMISAQIVFRYVYDLIKNKKIRDTLENTFDKEMGIELKVPFLNVKLNNIFKDRNWISFSIFLLTFAFFIFFGYHTTKYFLKKIDVVYVVLFWIIALGIMLLLYLRKIKMERRASNPLIGLISEPSRNNN